ncbi:MAG: TolC family protein [Fimbriimonadaceae bacterium]
MTVRAIGLTVLGLSFCSLGFGQDRLSLDDALTRAKERNGSVMAAFLNYRAAQQNARSAYSTFLPTVTPSVSHDVGFNETLTGPFRGRNDLNTTNAAIDVNWQILDDGSRKDRYSQARYSATSLQFSSLQTLRTTLFTVHTRFYDALRSQELLRVQNENLKRAKVILDQTIFRANPPIEDIPKKDILQAKADYENARVSVLTSENRVATSAADLKAVLAWDQEDLPDLVKPTAQQLPALVMTLQEAVVEGLANRADLEATRVRVQSQVLNVRLAKRDGFLKYSVDAGYRRIFAEDPFQRAAVTFSASFPLYDGDRTSSALEAERLTLAAIEANLEQDERGVRAEIESSYKEYGQNRLRYEASQAALEAAQENYNAAVAAQAEGAGNLLQVLTARVSLTTAESNSVEATYDLLISDIRFRLATGQSVPGE